MTQAAPSPARRRAAALRAMGRVARDRHGWANLRIVFAPFAAVAVAISAILGVLHVAGHSAGDPRVVAAVFLGSLASLTLGSRTILEIPGRRVGSELRVLGFRLSRWRNLHPDDEVTVGAGGLTGIFASNPANSVQGKGPKAYVHVAGCFAGSFDDEEAAHVEGEALARALGLPLRDATRDFGARREFPHEPLSADEGVASLPAPPVDSGAALAVEGDVISATVPHRAVSPALLVVVAVLFGLLGEVVSRVVGTRLVGYGVPLLILAAIPLVGRTRLLGARMRRGHVEITLGPRTLIAGSPVDVFGVQRAGFRAVEVVGRDGARLATVTLPTGEAADWLAEVLGLALAWAREGGASGARPAVAGPSAKGVPSIDAAAAFPQGSLVGALARAREEGRELESPSPIGPDGATYEERGGEAIIEAWPAPYHASWIGPALSVLAAIALGLLALRGPFDAKVRVGLGGMSAVMAIGAAVGAANDRHLARASRSRTRFRMDRERLRIEGMAFERVRVKYGYEWRPTGSLDLPLDTLQLEPTGDSVRLGHGALSGGLSRQGVAEVRLRDPAALAYVRQALTHAVARRTQGLLTRAQLGGA